MYTAPEEQILSTVRTLNSSMSVKANVDNENLFKKQKRIMRLQPRMAVVMSRILLFRSLVFTSTGLYVDRVIKRSATILGLALNKLVELDLLTIVRKGLLSSKWTSVYVKRLPPTSSITDRMQFELKLAELDVTDLSLQSLREASQEIVIDGKGKVSGQLMELLRRPEYSELNLDLDSLVRRSGEKSSTLHSDSTPLNLAGDIQSEAGKDAGESTNMLADTFTPTDLDNDNDSEGKIET